MYHKDHSLSRSWFWKRKYHSKKNSYYNNISWDSRKDATREIVERVLNVFEAAYPGDNTARELLESGKLLESHIKRYTEEVNNTGWDSPTSFALCAFLDSTHEGLLVSAACNAIQCLPRHKWAAEERAHLKILKKYLK